jgi:hypothetical protein
MVLIPCDKMKITYYSVKLYIMQNKLMYK